MKSVKILSVEISPRISTHPTKISQKCKLKYKNMHSAKHRNLMCIDQKA